MKLHDKILIYLFISLITVPYFLWFFADPKLKTENTLNRPFTVFPEFSSITYKQFPEQFDLWHSDHMPFRNILIRLYALTQYEILKDIENPRILFGKDGWLFYKDEHDGDPISDYKRVNLFTQEELEKITKNLRDLKTYLKRRNCEFIFTICPNKENMYYEYMPDAILRKNGISRTEQLLDYLKRHTDINIVYPYEELLEAKKKFFIYYKTDTHWNDIGGYITARDILSKLGISLKELDAVSITPSKKTGAQAAMGYDLANLSGAKDIFTEPYEYKISGYSEINPEITVLDHQIIRYVSPNASRNRLLVIRDSFSIPMMPILSAFYKDSTFIVYHYFSKECIDAEKPETFVYQAVERTLPALLNYNFEEPQ